MSTPRTELVTIAKGAVVAFLGNVCLLLLTALYQWLLASRLGPAQMGVLGLALSFTNVLCVLATAGLRDGAVRFVAQYASRQGGSRVPAIAVGGAAFTGAASLILAAALVLSAGTLASGLFAKADAGPTLRILALSIPGSALMVFLLAVTQGLKRMAYCTVIERFLVPLMKLAGLVAVVRVAGGSAVGAAFVVVVASTIGALLAAGSVCRLLPKGAEPTHLGPQVREMLVFSWPLLLTALVDRTGDELETFVLGVFGTSTQVGIYYVGLRVAALVAAVFQAFNLIFAPVMAELHSEHRRNALSSLLKTVTRWAVTLCLPVFVVLFVASEDVMAVFGRQYAEGGMVLGVLAVSQLVNVSTGPVGWLLIMTGHAQLNLVNSGLVLGINLGLDMLLIPSLGIMGAAIAAALAVALVNALRLVEVYLLLGTHPYSAHYWKPVTGGVLAVLAILVLRPAVTQLPLLVRVALTGVSSCCIYATALLALGLPPEDRALVAAAIDRWWPARHRCVPRIKMRSAPSAAKDRPGEPHG